MQNQSLAYKTLKAWLPLAAVTVILTGLVYGGVQQNYRQNANDPQIQIAEDIAAAIEQGTPPDSIVPPTGNTEISKTLSPWVMIFDDSGKLIGSSALYNGKNPDYYPTGVFENVKKTRQQERVTWQPEVGVRMATVVTRYTGKVSGFVVAGRSLREAEARVSKLTSMTAAAGALALVVSLLLCFMFVKLDEPKAERAEVTDEYHHPDGHHHPHLDHPLDHEYPHNHEHAS